MLLLQVKTGAGTPSSHCRFSPPEGIFAFATDFTGAKYVVLPFADRFSPPEGIFAFATDDILRSCVYLHSKDDWGFSPPEGIFAFATPLHLRL